MSLVSTGNISLDIKYIFLSFAQELFLNDAKYIWSANVLTTGIIIADKYAIDLGVVAHRPSIVLSRGSMSWLKLGLDQRINTSSLAYGSQIGTMGGPQGSANLAKNAKFTDLLRTSITFHVLAANGVAADDIANTLHIALLANKQALKAKGVHRILGITVSEEQLVNATSDIEVASISIRVDFTTQRTVQLGERQFNCRVYVAGTEVDEGINFRVDTNGTQVVFGTAPASGTLLTLTYVDAVTLDTITLAALGTGDGNTVMFTVPASGTIYGYYTLLSEILITGPNVTSQIITSGVTTSGLTTISGLWASVN